MIEQNTSPRGGPSIRLNEVTLQQFKAFFGQTTIRFKPITLIFGANSAGKSSIIHSLLLLHQLQQQTAGGLPHDVRFTALGGDAVDLGGYPHYAYRHTARLPVVLSTSLTIENVWSRRNTPEFKMIHYHDPTLTTGTETVIFSDTDLAGHQPVVMTHTRLNEDALCSTAMRGRTDERRISGDEELHYSAHPIFTSYFKEKYLLLIEELEERFQQYFLENREKLHFVSQIFSELKTSTEHLDLFTLTHINYEDKTRDFRMFRWTDPGAQITYNGISPAERLTRTALYRVITRYPHVTKLCDEATVEKILAPQLKAMQHVQILMNNESPLFGGLLHSSVFMQTSFLNTLRYIGPLRKIPSRYFSNADDTKLSIVDGTLAWEQLSLNPALVTLINKKLIMLRMAYKLKTQQPSNSYLIDKKYMDQHLEMLGDAHQLPPETLSELTKKIRQKLAVKSGKPHIELVDLHSNTIVSHRDVGIGVSQVLPILVNAYAETNATICIEQPELHLHPRLQGDLADVFIETTIGSEQNNSYIIETHSEAIIRRLMRRVREGKISKDDISIVYVEAGSEGSTVTHIHIDDDGDLVDEWPNGFFEEGFRDNMAGR